MWRHLGRFKHTAAARCVTFCDAVTPLDAMLAAAGFSCGANVALLVSRNTAHIASVLCGCGNEDAPVTSHHKADAV